MHWKYHIPHIWKDAERAIWEDIYLLPDTVLADKPSIWLTVDSIGSLESPDHDWSPEEYMEAKPRLGTNDFHIDGTDMLVRGDDFIRSEVVGWAKVWLMESGFPVDTLVEAPADEFANTNEHATFVASLKANLSE